MCFACVVIVRPCLLPCLVVLLAAGNSMLCKSSSSSSNSSCRQLLRCAMHPRAHLCVTPQHTVTPTTPPVPRAAQATPHSFLLTSAQGGHRPHSCITQLLTAAPAVLMPPPPSPLAPRPPRAAASHMLLQLLAAHDARARLAIAMHLQSWTVETTARLDLTARLNPVPCLRPARAQR